MLKFVVVFFFGSCPRELVSNSTLDYKDFVDPTTLEVEIVVQHDVEDTHTNF
jgi:hypothetical protein